MYAAALLTLALLGQSPSDRDLVDEAERAFAEGLAQRERGERGARSFRAAAVALETLRSRGCASGPLFRNLGNSYLLAGDLPQAIQAYRQGVRLAPDDLALRAALQFAREQVAARDPRLLPTSPTWSASAARWLCLGLALSGALGWVCLTRWWMVRGTGWLQAAVVGLTLAGSLGLLLLTQGASPRLEAVVVAEEGIFLRKGPGETFAPWEERTLPRGAEGRLVHRAEGWGQIELADGSVGWVRLNQLLID
ncbi:MAG: tetratricopeptide repeat protein [Gemmataceae bacterium]